MHRSRLFWALALLVGLALALLAFDRAGGMAVLQRWWHGSASQQIVLSGNIEAHESVLSFKGVQSRIVELPFDEGQSVRRGTVLAVVDSRDLAQQVAIAEAGVAVQHRQLAAAQDNLVAARRVIDADRAALEQRELDLKRNADLRRQGFVSDAALDSTRTALVQARAVLARDQALEGVAERNVKVAQASPHISPFVGCGSSMPVLEADSGLEGVAGEQFAAHSRPMQALGA